LYRPCPSIAKLSELTRWQAALRFEPEQTARNPGLHWTGAFQFGFMLDGSIRFTESEYSKFLDGYLPFDMVVRS